MLRTVAFGVCTHAYYQVKNCPVISILLYIYILSASVCTIDCSSLLSIIVNESQLYRCKHTLSLPFLLSMTMLIAMH
jgi:hypothetical protein